MKKTFRLLSAALLASALTAGAQETAAFSAPERSALRAIAADVAVALREGAIPAGAPLSILPIVDDDRDEFAYGLFKTAVTEAGRNCVESRDDPMWENIVQETAWSQRKGSVGVLDEATLTAFGKLQAANLLLYGNVRVENESSGACRVEVDLHVSSVKTRQHVWGRSFERAWTPPAARAPFTSDEREAIAQAMGEVVDSLKASQAFGDRAISILPIINDRGDVVYGYLKDAAVSAGRRCVEHRDDPMWNEVVAEMAFNVGNDGLLNQTMIARFGSLKSTDVLLYGTLRTCERKKARILVELDLRATDVKTREVIWSANVFRRWYATDADMAEGISNLPQVVRARLAATVRAKLVESLNAEAKLKETRSIALSPLQGDEDLYCSHILRDAITKSGLHVGNDFDRATFQGAKQTDAVAYGAVRSLDSKKTFDFLGILRCYRIDLDIQSAVSRNEGRDVLWSDTVQDSVVVSVWNWPKAIFFAIVLLIVLVFLCAILKAATRVR